MAPGYGYAVLATATVSSSVSWLSLLNTIIAGVVVAAIIALSRWVSAVERRLEKLEEWARESHATHAELKSRIEELWLVRQPRPKLRRPPTRLQLLVPVLVAARLLKAQQVQVAQVLQRRQRQL